MRILFSVAHPAQVHLFKNIINYIKNNNDDYIILSREKDVTNYLLKYYSYNYITISEKKIGFFNLFIEFIKRTIRICSFIKDYDPDIMISTLDPSMAISSKIRKIKYLALGDTEHAKLISSISMPFIDKIYTPNCCMGGKNDKQIRYNGYHQLAYLHNDYYKPNNNVLKYLSVTDNEKYIVLRLVAWGASHDMGQYGVKDAPKLVKKLNKICKVFISSEGNLPTELEKYQIKIPPEMMHDALYYATLYIGEGGSMASEAAILGTHSIHISSTAKHCGIFKDLNNYNLLWITDDENEALKIAIQLLDTPNLRENGKEKRKQLMDDKENVSRYFINLLYDQK